MFLRYQETTMLRLHGLLNSCHFLSMRASQFIAMPLIGLQTSGTYEFKGNSNALTLAAQ
jgi:hypothetical protein